MSYFTLCLQPPTNYTGVIRELKLLCWTIHVIGKQAKKKKNSLPKGGFWRWIFPTSERHKWGAGAPCDLITGCVLARTYLKKWSKKNKWKFEISHSLQFINWLQNRATWSFLIVYLKKQKKAVKNDVLPCSGCHDGAWLGSSSMNLLYNNCCFTPHVPILSFFFSYTF